ncbi:TetR/AcrR family transcriptional regulator [Halomonas sp. GFAJ-1]|uniref:TetR/AcrR family transcriptional regulator n=1 Tax=Halomonas sp. GFAJ-1 TaxID=1118153 RepID=UPI00023A4BC7|nr:TetR/AcrR family transcriptional regulator [Halomonas sp. GFAJ-1]AVI62264.1 TetR family transcriptional regulator [Halomonas sp. GFAJ-1]EHK60261.1 TetR family transcriptional regulator [Halomonas sp. GFAJ-1]
MARTQDEIRQTNVKKILQAAEQLFAEKGYAGASMGEIAQLANIPKSNVHYYFSTKKALYQEVLLALLEVWKQDALCFELYDDPRVVLTSYIRAKMNHSRYRAHGSKIWAAEVMQGAPILKDRLRDNLYEWAKLKESKIREWIESGQITPVEPSYLLYMIWASTQHYADFDYQIALLNDDKPLDDLQFEKAVQSVTTVILRGIGLTA